MFFQSPDTSRFSSSQIPQMNLEQGPSRRVDSLELTNERLVVEVPPSIGSPWHSVQAHTTVAPRLQAATPAHLQRLSRGTFVPRTPAATPARSQGLSLSTFVPHAPAATPARSQGPRPHIIGPPRAQAAVYTPSPGSSSRTFVPPRTQAATLHHLPGPLASTGLPPRTPAAAPPRTIVPGRRDSGDHGCGCRENTANDAHAGPKGPERTGLCVICQDEEAIMAVVDCGHLAMCKECSDGVMSTSRACPLCRTNISQARLIRIFKT